MIKITDRHTVYDMDFQRYLKSPEFSNSKLKEFQKEFVDTSKTRIGKYVDTIISGEPLPVVADPGELKQAIHISRLLKKEYGYIIDHSFKQVSYFCEVESDFGFKMRMKTRPDFVADGFGTIDLKITWSRINAINDLISFMGYDKQIYIHKLLSGYDNGALMFYSVPDKKVKFMRINPDCEDWMEEKLMIFGEPI
jgi:hypothetical protein